MNARGQSVSVVVGPRKANGGVTIKRGESYVLSIRIGDRDPKRVVEYIAREIQAHLVGCIQRAEAFCRVEPEEPDDPARFSCLGEEDEGDDEDE